MLGKPKQPMDVTQADDGDIQSEPIGRHLAKGSHLMMGISKEKSLRNHHQCWVITKSILIGSAGMELKA